jgi:putative ABC transport system ATP-binding protein
VVPFAESQPARFSDAEVVPLPCQIGLERPDAGTLRLGDQRVDGLSEASWARLRRRTIGFVFQAFNLVDELTAIENVELPALLVGTSRRAARRRATQLLERLGVADRAGHPPDLLSGGQRQRVALARALINEPLVVLADEPTGNLDSHATNEILRLFAELRDTQQTLVLVTHDSRVGATAERLITMHDGTIVDDTRLDGGQCADPDVISLAATTANLDRTSTLGFTIAAFLIALAVINAMIAAVFSAHDSARNHAILRTLGATPGQTVTAFLVAHLAACLLACAVGIPLGIALYTPSEAQPSTRSTSPRSPTSPSA